LNKDEESNCCCSVCAGARRGYNPQFSTAHLLHAALNALLTLADTTKSWRPLAETADSKLSKRG
jgi:hypothetical protein